MQLTRNIISEIQPASLSSWIAAKAVVASAVGTLEWGLPQKGVDATAAEIVNVHHPVGITR